MTEREPVERSTRQLIEDGRARQEALAGIDRVLDEVRGTAYDQHQSIRVTVDGRGRLLDLWLRQDAVRWGAERLGALIVRVAEAAMAEATQQGYNRLAPLLGDSMTYAIEQISGLPAPARDPGRTSITAEEFQRRRDERVGGGGNTGDSGDTPSSHVLDDDGWDPDDPLSFDLSRLRSDR